MKKDQPVVKIRPPQPNDGDQPAIEIRTPAPVHGGRLEVFWRLYAAGFLAEQGPAEPGFELPAGFLFVEEEGRMDAGVPATARLVYGGTPCTWKALLYAAEVLEGELFLAEGRVTYDNVRHVYGRLFVSHEDAGVFTLALTLGGETLH